MVFWDFILFIIVCSLFIGLLVLEKKTLHTYFSLSFLFTVYWFAFFVLSWTFTCLDYEWSFLSCFYVVLFSFFLYLGSLIASKVVGRTHISFSQFGARKIDSHFLFSMLILSFFLGLIYPLYVIKLSGGSFLDLFSFSSLSTIASSFYMSKDKGIDTPTSINFFLSFIYLCPLLGGFLFSHSRKLKKIAILVLSLIPTFYAFLVTTTKAGILASFFLFLIGYIANVFYTRKPIKQIKKKLFFMCICSLVVIVVLFVSMLFRYNGDLSHVLARFPSYAFGAIPAFDYWLSSSFSLADRFYLGENTFIGIFNLLGIVSRQKGIYSTGFVSGSISTNIYTVFRGLILDYGIFGSFLFSYLWGFLSRLIVQKTFYRPYSSFFGHLVICFSLFFMLWSFLVSSFSYNSFVFGILCFCFILLANTYFVEKKSRKVICLLACK
jgi:oligosaccharide repeat unit polymerase